MKGTKSMTFLIFGFIAFSAIALSGCDELNQHYNPGGSERLGGGEEECGYYYGPCCTWYGRDEFGQYTARYYCDEGLECRAETCVEGPEYQAHDRNSGY